MWQLGEGEDMLARVLHAPGAGGHSPSVKPMHKPFGRSVAAHSASNGGDLEGFETTGNGSTERSKNHEDP